MIDLLSTMQVMLQEAGFITRLTSMDRSSIVCFEDDTVAGFGLVFDSPELLLEHWKVKETALLKRYAPSLRVAGEKAWNIYCLFVCAAPADLIQSREVRWIEEDLERTRKIAACGVRSREDLMRALLPVLPLQYQPQLRPEDVTERLESRIRVILPKAPHIVLDQSVSLAEVVKLLGERA
jgi:hypothetical protein